LGGLTRSFDTVRITGWVYAVYWWVFVSIRFWDPHEVEPIPVRIVGILLCFCAGGSCLAVIRRKRLGYQSCRLFSLCILLAVPTGTILGWNMLRALRRNRSLFYTR